MKVFVTGIAGQVGYDVAKELKKRGHLVVESDIHHRCTEETNHR